MVGVVGFMIGFRKRVWGSRKEFSLGMQSQAFFIICGVIYQLLNGFTRIELDVYILDFVFTSLMTYIVWSGVMIMIQVLLNNKYIGYFASIMVVFVWGIMLSIFDVQSNMLAIGGRPGLIYSDMNSFGPSLSGVIWFNLYWVLFSFICLLIAGALWNRGVISSIKERIQIAKKQIPKSYRLIIVGTISCWIAVAGFIFYIYHKNKKKKIVSDKVLKL